MTERTEYRTRRRHWASHPIIWIANFAAWVLVVAVVLSCAA